MPIEQGAVSLQRKPMRKDGWTLARRTVFLDALSRSCNATQSARAAGKDISSARALRKRDPEFAQLWLDAIAEGAQRLREELLAQQLDQLPSGYNPVGDRPVEAAVPLDVDKALKVLAMHGGFAGGVRTRTTRAPTQGEVDAALMARLEMLARPAHKAAAAALPAPVVARPDEVQR